MAEAKARGKDGAGKGRVFPLLVTREGGLVAPWSVRAGQMLAPTQ